MSRHVRRRTGGLVAFLGCAFVCALLPAAGAVAQSEGGSNHVTFPGDGLVEVTVPNKAAIEDLIARGYDLGEYARPNEDGSLTIQVSGTEDDINSIADLGYAPGRVLEDEQTWLDRIAEREAAIAAEQRAQEAAETGIPPNPSVTAEGTGAVSKLAAPGFVEPDELYVQRVDYYTNYAGRFLSVEVRDKLGTATGGPTLAMSWKEAGGSYGTATTMAKNVDPDTTPDTYINHRSFIRVGALGTTTPVPATVRIASSTGAIVEAPVRDWNNGNPPPLGIISNFQTKYVDPTEGKAKIDALAAEFPDIAEIVELPFQTNGYRRKSMAIMNGTGNIGNAPTGATAPTQAVVLFSDQYTRNDIQAEFLNPAATNSPLQVSVVGTKVTVRLATGATGALTSTAAQVVAALNASPDASALVDAFTWAGNAGAGVTQPRALVNLSDFLNAPAGIARAPFTQHVIRIGKHRDGSKVGVYIYCQEHAREWVTPLVCLETAERLVRNYATDPLTKSFVDNLDIFILPTVNSDGAHYSMYNSGQQRRNMTDYCPTNATSGMPSQRNAWGVDNNRNFSVGSLFDGYFGASSSCTNDTFAGPSELSEPENRNEISIPTNHANIKFSMNVHSSGGYFMWSPASYKNDGFRTTLPYPNIGIEGYFWETAAKVLDRIKQWRGTVIEPQLTGPVMDVLYSAAGNSSDEMYYKFNIIAYDFEVGADRFSSTTTGTARSGVGFQPNFATEGNHEAQEFANGNYGLLEKALEYSNDLTPPSASIVPNGGASQAPIQATFNWDNESSIIHYTLDGSTPTLASQTWEAQGPRRPGQVFQFNETTTVKWIAVDIKGNVSDVHSARFAVETDPPTTTASFDPAEHGGYYVNPTITLTADDDFDGGGSGVAQTWFRLDSSDASAWQLYSGPFQVTGDGHHTLDFFSVDNAGNAEAPQSIGFDVDATPPTIDLVKPPEGGQYLLGSSQLADYSCADNLSGIDPADCVGTVPDGEPFSTSPVGFHTFTVNATDKAGNTASVTHQYNVYWPFTGFFQPIDNDRWNVAQAGSAIPVKFSLGGNRGLAIFATGYPKAIQVPCDADGPFDTIESTVTAGGSSLSFGDGQYVYVWKTNTAWAGTCRQLVVKLDDNTTHTALFKFKK